MQTSKEPFANQHIQDTFQGKIKQNKTIRPLFKKKILCPRAVAEAGAHQPLLPADLKRRISNKRVWRTKDVNLKATNGRKGRASSTSHPELTQEIAKMHEHSRAFVFFSFSKSWRKRRARTFLDGNFRHINWKKKTSMDREILLEYILLCMSTCNLSSFLSQKIFQEILFAIKNQTRTKTKHLKET